MVGLQAPIKPQYNVTTSAFLTLKIRRLCFAKEILSDQETDMASQSANHNLQRLDSMERKDIKDVSKRVDLLEQREKFQPPSLKNRRQRHL